ncbi:MAG: hypothetical protein J0L81_04270 [Caulobacterales bacterium]|jgi:hypothetical protein|nr:hypothetical protein [Caulobacterales bacterium]
MNFATLWRVIWPERGPLFVVVGGIVSLAGDFASFLGNIASPQILVWPAVGLAGLLSWFCLGQVSKIPATAEPAAQEQAIQCRECDAFRVMLFATIGVVLLLLAGQGTTATERIGTQLGLIQEDVSAIREDTTAIRDVTSSGELVRNPRSAEDFYRNAWIHNMMRRDAAASWDAIQELYRRHTPNKLDAADLYFQAGRSALTREQLLAQMIQVGRERRDASMLVTAARNIDSNDEAFALLNEARAIDADLPFAYWDPMRPQFIQLVPGATPEQNLAQSQRAVQGIETFIEVAGRKPVASYYYQPQYAPDMETFARGQLETYRGTLANWQRVVDMHRR